MEHLKSRLPEVCGLCEASSGAAESYLPVSPDLSDGNLCGAKANILRPLQQLAKHQFFHTANATVITQPNVSGCRPRCIHPSVPCLIVSECCKCFTCILETQSVHPILVKAKKKKSKLCAFWTAYIGPVFMWTCKTLAKTQCPSVCWVEKSFKICGIILSNLL